MTYVEYIQTDGYCWFDTGILPSINTSAELSFSPGPKAGDWPVYFGRSYNDWDNTTYTFKSNNQGTKFDARFGNVPKENIQNFTVWDDYLVIFNNTGITINGNVATTWSPSIESEAVHTLWIAAENNTNTGGDWNRHRASIAKFYYLKLWENGVLIGDYRPAIDDNDNIGFFDEVSQTFKTNLGTGTPVAGPSLSSINVSASKTSLAAAGESITINVDTENDWVVSQTGNWLTLSATGGTGSTTITATAPSYSGATAREDTLTFVDMNTTDEAVIKIKQKKYTSGQPLYLGGDEITEIYLGADSISEAYLGEDLVYSSGPFVGLKLIPKEMTLKSRQVSVGTTAKINVKSSESWSLSTAADWFTLSPTTGTGTGNKEEVMLTVTSIPTAETTSVISCTTANFSASTEIVYQIGYGIPANEIWYATTDSSKITSLNRWSVYSTGGTKMTTFDSSTYGKLVFPNPIGYVAGDLYNTTGGWRNLTELGLPAMVPAMCTGANDFGLKYIDNAMTAWTRVYGDYEYIDATETMAWGSDGGGCIVARGKTGAFVVPEGFRGGGAYAFARSQFSSLEFPTTFVGGVTGLNNGAAIGGFMFEDMANLTSIKYKSTTPPTAWGNNGWNRVNSNGIAYYPEGVTAYTTTNWIKPNNFTWQSYSNNTVL